MTNNVAFILKGYPRLSETFIAQEIRALETRGLNIHIYSLRLPTDRVFHPIHHEIEAPVTYLPEYLYKEPRRLWRAWLAMRHKPGYQKAKKAAIADFKRTFHIRQFRRLGQAIIMAHELPESVHWIHAHFMHAAASTARLVAMMKEMPWSLSGHAIDIWTFPAWDNAQKLKECAWAVTCTERNLNYLRSLAPDQNRIDLVYHGLDFSRFPPPPEDQSRNRVPRNGNNAEDPFIILSVGRAVEKKGYVDLLNALAELPEGLHWRFVHIGGGDRLEKLKDQAERLGIGSRIDWRGSMAQADVLEAYRQADLFVLPSKVARNGDRDGLPNVLMEAMSQALTCLSTQGASAADELITDGETGVLVDPEEATLLAQAIEQLCRDPKRRLHLGKAGMNYVRRQFSFEAGIETLSKKFNLPSTQNEKTDVA